MKALTYAILIISAIAVSSPVLATVREVDCDKGQTITHALKVANVGDTISVTGICNESAVITTDGLTLEGGGSAVIDGSGLPTSTSVREGGLITVDTARDVTVRDISVVNSPKAGVVVLRGASVDIDRVTVDTTKLTGIYIYENASVDIMASTVTEAGGGGILVNGNSYVALKGEISSSGNKGDGIVVWGESTLDLLGAVIEASDNGRAGLFAFDAQIHANTVGFVGANTVSAKNNGFAGIAIVDGGSLVFSRQTDISASRNPSGLLVSNGAVANPFGAGRFLLSENQVGINVARGSRFSTYGEQTVSGNETGLLADNAADITLGKTGGGVPRITGNTTDVVLRFGSHVTFTEVEFYTITCDDTVLTRDAGGSSLCP